VNTKASLCREPSHVFPNKAQQCVRAAHYRDQAGDCAPIELRGRLSKTTRAAAKLDRMWQKL
jgi:hypothetical protein